MRLLLPNRNAPSDEVPGGRLGDDELAQLYEYPPCTAEGQPWVRANFVSTLDGAATGSDGRSGSINTGADREVFGLLRALSDVVLVGAGTARIEGYRPIKARDKWTPMRQRTGRTDHPVMAVVSRTAVLPSLLTTPVEHAGDVLLLTCGRASKSALDHARAELGEDQVLVIGEESVDLDATLRELARRGLTRVLCEGGPHLMRDLVASGHLDELCLTIAPLIVAGEHSRITAGAGLVQHLEPQVLIESEGSLLGRWARPGSVTPPETP